MLNTIAIILVVAWLVGVMTATTYGGLINLLLLAAIILFVIRYYIGGKPLVR